MRVLVVEDEPEVSDLLSRTLREAGWAVDAVARGLAALEHLAVTEYDIAVVDIGLPDVDGVEVCRRLRARGGTTPVLILTAFGGISDRVRGLDAGADDYLAKPFAIEELLARLRALSRRPSVPLPVLLQVDDLVLDTSSARVRRGDTPIHLSARERALLEYLLRRPHRAVTRGQILDHVWDDNFDPVGNVVDVLIARLRRKIDTPGKRPLIHTIRGTGYILSDRAQDAG
jgi:two-component system copper resistance phosphate regulon response regulator CusR